MNPTPAITAPEQINTQLLPPRLQELASIIGLPAALRLCEARPGLPTYIPAIASR